ncbi:MAG: hypothetical protein AB7G62_14390 [Magnetospirillum sp.]
MNICAIHIGFPKTGSTWLQNIFLPQLTSVSAFGKNPLDLHSHNLVGKLLAADEFEFDADQYRAEIEGHINSHPQIYGDRPIILTHEYLSGGEYDGYGAAQLAQRLRRVFGQTRVIITIREQSSAIESLYRHYIRHGGHLNIQQFLFNVSSPCVDENMTPRLLQKYKYSNIVKYYMNIFGRQNVHVVIFEKFKDGPGEVAKHYMNAMNNDEDMSSVDFSTRENAGISYWCAWVARLINNWVWTPYHETMLPSFIRWTGHQWLAAKVILPLNSLMPRTSKRFVDQPIRDLLVRNVKKALGRKNPNDDKRIKEFMDEYFAQSNKELSDLIGTDLSKFGYAMPEIKNH